MTNDPSEQIVLRIAMLRDHFIQHDRFTPLEDLFSRLPRNGWRISRRAGSTRPTVWRCRGRLGRAKVPRSRIS